MPMRRNTDRFRTVWQFTQKGERYILGAVYDCTYRLSPVGKVPQTLRWPTGRFGFLSASHIEADVLVYKLHDCA
jgi:hypothetical protein